MKKGLGSTFFDSREPTLLVSEDGSSDRPHDKGVDGADLTDTFVEHRSSESHEKTPTSVYHTIFHAPTVFPRVGTNLFPHHLPRFLPSINFPNQGHGRSSEFNQEPPMWVHQPLKALYTVFFILVTAFVFLPWQAIRTIPRSQRGRPSWSWLRSITIIFLRRCISYACKTHVILTKKAPKHEPKLKHSEFTWIEPARFLRPAPSSDNLVQSPDFRGELLRAMAMQEVALERICGYWYFAPKSDLHCTTPAQPNEQVIYYLHGGAYWMGSAHESSPNAGMDRQLLARLTKCKGDVPRRLFALEYRLADHDHPKRSYPAALVDALVGYLYLTRYCGFAPENILLSGDSSGGNLALALCRYLRDERVAGMPGSLLLISPWSDVSRSHSGPIQAPNAFSTTVLNRDSDIIDSSIMYRNTSVCAFLGRLPASETYLNPYISPVSLQLDSERGGRPPHWGFSGFPKRTYIVTGSAELNTEQHLTLAHRLAQGTVHGIPEYVGDRISAGQAPEQFVWRDCYPRSHRVAHLHNSTDYFAARDACPLEEREVVLDEVKDAVHVFPMFSWFEPERTQTIDRIARWIAHEPIPQEPVRLS